MPNHNRCLWIAGISINILSPAHIYGKNTDCPFRDKQGPDGKCGRLQMFTDVLTDVNCFCLTSIGIARLLKCNKVLE